MGGFSYARLPADAELGESNGQNLWALSCIAQDWHRNPPAAGVRTLHAEESQKFSCNLKNMPAIEEIEKTIKAAPEASEIAF